MEPQSVSNKNPSVIIGLSAVVVAAGAQGPEILLSGEDGALGLPFGSFDPVGHRTFELAVRDFVTAQTGFAVGFVEQLYTFGDKGREAPRADMGNSKADDRVVSVGYLALAGDVASEAPRAGAWLDWYQFFPWEDQRTDRGVSALSALIPALLAWSVGKEARARVNAAFGLESATWQEARVLERYELLYEAGLILEALRDRADAATSPLAFSGQALVSDHRRILATAIGRMRAKIRYRPIIFDVAPNTFTLSSLQDLVEHVCGVRLHKQNFRRTLEHSGLVTPTGDVLQETGGRPAKLFTRSPSSFAFGAPGLSLPLLRR
jgi:hypothetical protein